MTVNGGFTLLVALPGGGTQSSVWDQKVSLGRDPSSKVHLPNPLVSRAHATLELADGTFVVTDLGSRNGTIVNGQLIRGDTAHLDTDAHLEIGPFQITAVRGNSDTQETFVLARPLGSPHLAVDAAHRRVRVAGQLVGTRLSPQEYRFVELLCLSAPGLVETMTMGDGIWGEGGWERYMLHNLARRVRHKIGDRADGAGSLIITVPGAGYRAAGSQDG